MTMARLAARIFLGCVTLAMTACCLGGGNSKVEIFCKPAGSQVNCTATQTAGLGNVRACWDIRLACTNGISSVANTCANVDGTTVANHQVATAEFKDYTKCVSPSVKAVENVKVTSR